MAGSAFLFMLAAFAAVVVWYVQNVETDGGGARSFLGLRLDPAKPDNAESPGDGMGAAAQEEAGPAGEMTPRERVRAKLPTRSRR